MTTILEFVPLISAAIFAGLLGVSLWQFSIVRKNMRAQTEQQIYASILQLRTKLEDTEVFTNMAKESELYRERFSLVNNPSEYYTVVAFHDLLEYIFRLHKTEMIDEELWHRWTHLAEIIMSIPKFRKLWEVTRQSHTKEFADFIDNIIARNVEQ